MSFGIYYTDLLVFIIQKSFGIYYTETTHTRRSAKKNRQTDSDCLFCGRILHFFKSDEQTAQLGVKAAKSAAGGDLYLRLRKSISDAVFK